MCFVKHLFHGYPGLIGLIARNMTSKSHCQKLQALFKSLTMINPSCTKVFVTHTFYEGGGGGG